MPILAVFWYLRRYLTDYDYRGTMDNESSPSEGIMSFKFCLKMSAATGAIIGFVFALATFSFQVGLVVGLGGMATVLVIMLFVKGVDHLVTRN